MKIIINIWRRITKQQPSWELHIWAGKLQSLTPKTHTFDVIWKHVLCASAFTGRCNRRYDCFCFWHVLSNSYLWTMGKEFTTRISRRLWGRNAWRTPKDICGEAIRHPSSQAVEILGLDVWIAICLCVTWLIQSIVRRTVSFSLVCTWGLIVW